MSETTKNKNIILALDVFSNEVLKNAAYGVPGTENKRKGLLDAKTTDLDRQDLIEKLAQSFEERRKDDGSIASYKYLVFIIDQTMNRIKTKSSFYTSLKGILTKNKVNDEAWKAWQHFLPKTLKKRDQYFIQQQLQAKFKNAQRKYALNPSNLLLQVLQIVRTDIFAYARTEWFPLVKSMGDGIKRVFNKENKTASLTLETQAPILSDAAKTSCHSPGFFAVFLALIDNDLVQTKDELRIETAVADGGDDDAMPTAVENRIMTAASFDKTPARVTSNNNSAAISGSDRDDGGDDDAVASTAADNSAKSTSGGNSTLSNTRTAAKYIDGGDTAADNTAKSKVIGSDRDAVASIDSNTTATPSGDDSTSSNTRTAAKHDGGDTAADNSANPDVDLCTRSSVTRRDKTASATWSDNIWQGVICAASALQKQFIGRQPLLHTKDDVRPDVRMRILSMVAVNAMRWAIKQQPKKTEYDNENWYNANECVCSLDNDRTLDFDMWVRLPSEDVNVTEGSASYAKTTKNLFEIEVCSTSENDCAFVDSVDGAWLQMHNTLNTDEAFVITAKDLVARATSCAAARGPYAGRVACKNRILLWDTCLEARSVIIDKINNHEDRSDAYSKLMTLPFWKLLRVYLRVQAVAIRRVHNIACVHVQSDALNELFTEPFASDRRQVIGQVFADFLPKPWGKMKKQECNEILTKWGCRVLETTDSDAAENEARPFVQKWDSISTAWMIECATKILEMFGASQTVTAKQLVHKTCAKHSAFPRLYAPHDYINGYPVVSK